MPQSQLLNYCKTRDQEDLFWYFLCSAPALGLHAIPIEPHIPSADGGNTVDPVMLADARRYKHVRDALRLVLPEYRAILERCYSVPRVDKCEATEKYRIATGYVAHVNREVDAGRTPQWLADAQRGKGGSVWERAYIELQRRIGKRPAVDELCVDRVEHAHVLYSLARDKCRRAAQQEKREHDDRTRSRGAALFDELCGRRPVVSSAVDRLAQILREMGVV